MFLFGTWKFLGLFCPQVKGYLLKGRKCQFRIQIFTLCLWRCVDLSRNATVTTRQGAWTPLLVSAVLGRTAGLAVTAHAFGSSKSSSRAVPATTASPGLPTSPPSPRTWASSLLTSSWLLAGCQLWAILAPVHRRPFPRPQTSPAHLRRRVGKR